MTVPTNDARRIFTGNGTATVFDFPFPYQSPADIKVYEQVVATGVETLLPQNGQYVLTPAPGGGPGGRVTTSAPVAVGRRLAIVRDPVPVQETDLVENDKFFAETIERGFDLLTMVQQRQLDQINRALTLREADVTGTGAFNARGNRITGLATGTGDTDAVNRAQMEARLGALLTDPIFIDPALRQYVIDQIVAAAQFNTQAVVGQALQPRTADETTAGVTPSAYHYPPGDIRRYGAVSGSGDCSAAITAAMSANKYVLIPPGDWRCDTRQDVPAGVAIEVQGVVTRYTAHSAATTPVFWLSYERSAIFGSGSNAKIKSENRAPDGVVLIGASSMSASMGRDIQYCTLARIKVEGATPYGQTSGDPDVAVMMIGPQLDGKVNYFHRVIDVDVNAANYGLHLKGWSNGMLITNLHGYWIGNPTLSAHRALVYSQGALDNYLSGLFHHFSPDTPTLKIEDLNNTGVSGGSNHVTAYSTFLGIGCEQGGALALALKANANCTAFKNYLQIIDNVSAGYDISTNFRDVNTVIFASTGANFEDVQVRGSLVTSGAAALNGLTTFKQNRNTDTAVTYSASMAIDASLGNGFTITATNNTAFTIANPTNSQVGQTIRITIRNTSGGALGTLTWGSNFRAADTTQPADGTSRTRYFEYYGTLWVERAPGVDVAN